MCELYHTKCCFCSFLVIWRLIKIFTFNITLSFVSVVAKANMGLTHHLRNKLKKWLLCSDGSPGCQCLLDMSSSFTNIYCSLCKTMEHANTLHAFCHEWIGHISSFPCFASRQINKFYCAPSRLVIGSLDKRDVSRTSIHLSFVCASFPVQNICKWSGQAGLW